MHNWELQETKDAMVEQSVDYADKQETLGAGIAAMRERVSSERARNRASMTKVQDTNRLLEKTATEAGMEARSLRRQLEVQNSHTLGVQAVLEDEATDLRQELGQLRTENEELRLKNRGLLDELRIAKSETEGVEARRVKLEKQKSYVAKKVTQLEATNDKITVEMQKLRKANRVLVDAEVNGLKTMAGAEARAAQAEKQVIDLQQQVLHVETKLGSITEELKDYKSRCHNFSAVCFAFSSHLAGRFQS
jgi:chromosome segregation ATPase